MTLLELMFGPKCNHDWEVKSERRIPSQLEEILDRISNAGDLKYSSQETQSKDIVIMACRKCGKVDKTITSRH